MDCSVQSNIALITAHGREKWGEWEERFYDDDERESVIVQCASCMHASLSPNTKEEKKGRKREHKKFQVNGEGGRREKISPQDEDDDSSSPFHFRIQLIDPPFHLFTVCIAV